jgi:hypothetical protein
MNSKDLASSTPYTIQYSDNYLKDYINTSGFKWDSSCLDVVFKELGNKFNDYVQKVGDFNTIAVQNDPIYTPPRSYQEKDYSGSCPDGWTKQAAGGCTNQNYNVKPWGECVAGRTKQVKRSPPCPPNSTSGRENISNSYYVNVTRYYRWWGWNIPYTSREIRYTSYPNPNYYPGWNGPYEWNNMTYCYTNGDNNRADWQNTAKTDCVNSGGSTEWGPNYCIKQYKYDPQTEAPSYFNGYSNANKTDWENTCQAYWPMKTVNVPEKYTCEYGEKLADDIARGNILNIGMSYSIFDAAIIALKSNKMIDNYFAIIDNNIYITRPNSVQHSVHVFLKKGRYQKNCPDNNNRKVTLYVINQKFFDMLKNCKTINNSLNALNESRDTVQNAITSVSEKFIGGSRNSKIIEHLQSEDILKNQNEISANLISNYNKKAELYNYQVGLLGQNEKLVEDHNKKLNTQLDELSQIQDQIALKDRVIVLNDELSQKQIRNKKILIGFFVLIPFLGIPLLLIVSKAFSPMIGISIAVLMVVGYIIYMIVVANQSDIRKFGRENKNVISKYEKSLANYWNKQKEALRSSLNNFVNENCANNGLQEGGGSGGGGGDGGGGGGGGSGGEGSGGGGGGGSGAYPKGDYLMKSNGPFYYYDGSAPPQQIYPGATGSINFNIEGENQKFPNIDFSKIKNPVTKFFFQTWLAILKQNNIEPTDPRFNEVLDVIDFPDSDQTPMPFWDNIKLPIVTNINQQFNYLFQSYSGEKRNLSQTASVLLVDLWNFIFGDKIPGDVYGIWVNKLADVVKQPTPNIEKFYSEYLKSIMGLTKFTDKYGSGATGLEKFVQIKMVDFIKTFNQDISVSQQFAKKYVP